MCIMVCLWHHHSAICLILFFYKKKFYYKEILFNKNNKNDNNYERILFSGKFSGQKSGTKFGDAVFRIDMKHYVSSKIYNQDMRYDLKILNGKCRTRLNGQADFLFFACLSNRNQITLVD